MALVLNVWRIAKWSRLDLLIANHSPDVCRPQTCRLGNRDRGGLSNLRNTFRPPQFRLSRQTPFVPSLAILVLTLAVFAVGQDFSYRDSHLPIDQRVSILPQMTLEERVDQLMGGRHARHLDDPESKEAFEKLRKLWP